MKLKEHTLITVSINPNAYIKADYDQLKHIFAYCTPMSSSADKQRKKASFIYLKLAMSSQRTALLPLQRMKYFSSRTKFLTNVITFQPIQNSKNKLNWSHQKNKFIVCKCVSSKFKRKKNAGCYHLIMKPAMWSHLITGFVIKPENKQVLFPLYKIWTPGPVLISKRFIHERNHMHPSRILSLKHIFTLCSAL